MLSTLTIGQQQLVATARAALRGTRFLIFDEPTAYLTRQEAAQLFALIRRLKADGVTLVYISHRLEEVFELADRVTILRDGALISTERVADTNEQRLIRGMIARSIEQIYHKDPVAPGPELVATQGLSGQGFSDISIDVRRGEIVGLYGLIGAGRSEFVQALFGRHLHSAGIVHWEGRPVDDQLAAAGHSARHGAGAREPAGPRVVPEPRRFDQPEPHDFRPADPGAYVIDGRAEARAADAQIGGLRILTASHATLAQSLSGGNQQKIVVGKWLAHGAQLFHLRRADRRRRRRHQGRDLPPVRSACCRRAPASS